jgi:hypothetical protein
LVARQEGSGVVSQFSTMMVPPVACAEVARLVEYAADGDAVVGELGAGGHDEVQALGGAG